MTFKLWSEIKKEAKRELSPDFGFRDWNDLESDDKKKIWLYLWKRWFFDSRENDLDAFCGCGKYTSDQDKDKDEKLKRIVAVLDILNQKHKAKAYARDFLDNRNVSTALKSFYNIYLGDSENVVFELLSIYASRLVFEREDDLRQKEGESDREFRTRNDEYKWEKFDNFCRDLNDLFDDFGIYVFLSRYGFVPRQDEKIIENIYHPVLKILYNDEYKNINQMLKRAFKNFRDNDFDKVIQNSINSMHAYLQIKLSKKIGKGNFKTLLKEAKKQKIIPYDELIVNLYDNIESFLARERKNKTAAHPSNEKSTSNDALFVLNLTMIILQSFLNFKK